MITKTFFGTTEQGQVDSYLLDNGKGLSAEILSLGGIIRKLIFADTDVVLGRDELDAYIGDGAYLGALVGRNSNRIVDCEFELNGKTYTLAANDSGRNNNLHGGVYGFSSKIWDAEAIDGEEPQLILKTSAKDGEEGFPGNVEVTVTYTLTKENSIKIHYEGTTDADTVMNMTNHSYFNLNGAGSGKILNHKLWLNCDFFTPNSPVCAPDGTILPVKDTPFDFTVAKEVGKEIFTDIPQLSQFLGYDHNFIINGSGYRKCAILTGDKITMETYTNQPAVQFYAGNYLNSERNCKNGCEYAPNDGLCLETQCYPNALKYGHFPSPILKKGEKYDTVTEYKFTLNGDDKCE